MTLIWMDVLMNPLVELIPTCCNDRIIACLEQGHTLTRQQLSIAFMSLDNDQRSKFGPGLVDLLAKYSALPKGVSTTMLKTMLSA